MEIGIDRAEENKQDDHDTLSGIEEELQLEAPAPIISILQQAPEEIAIDVIAKQKVSLERMKQQELEDKLAPLSVHCVWEAQEVHALSVTHTHNTCTHTHTLHTEYCFN